METLADLVASFEQHQKRPAIIAMTEDGSESLNYVEMAGRVTSLAAGLAESGIQPGAVAALLSDNRPSLLIAALAVIRAGGIVLPLDVQMGDDNLRHVLEDSRVELIFVNREQETRLRELAGEDLPRLVRLDTDEGHGGWRGLMSDAKQDFPEPGPDDQAALFYTSGTTGPPKGVPLTHRNLAFQLDTVRRTGLVIDSDRVLLPLPLHHVYPFVIGMMVPLSLGLPIILPNSLTGPQILRAIREQEVTVVIGVPRLYRALLSGITSQAEQRGRAAAFTLGALLSLSTMLRRRFGLLAGRWLLKPVHRQFGPSLRILASGGSHLDPELAWRLEGVGWQVAVGYGLTETAPLLTIKLPGGGRLDSVGPPVEGIELRIDTKGASAAKKEDEEETGEVLARGPSVFRGYRNLPDKTAKAFTEDGWFRTGDLGSIDKDGYLHLSGRASTMIITESGEKVQPEEVEKVYGSHPVIEEIGILERDNRLTAVIVPRLSTIRERDQEIREAVREAVNAQAGKLPSYQRVADYVISRQSLPRTRLGKIRRHLLAEKYREAREEEQGKGKLKKGPQPLSEMSDRDQALLENEAAKMVWDWLAGRYPNVLLTPDTSPQLDLGIDSMEWLNLTMEISQRTGRELDDETIGRIEKVRDLLEAVAEEQESGRGVDPERPLTSPEEVLREDQRRWLRPLGPGLSVLRRIAYSVNRVVMRLLFRIRVQGLDRLPRDQQFVLSPNHVSYLDAFAVAAALPLSKLDRMFFAGWTGVAFSNPLFRFGSRLAKAVPIDSRQGVSSSLAFGASVLKSGESLIWFPEGGRSPDGSLQEFKMGIGLLLKYYPVRVVPVHIRGAYQALPVGRLLPRLTRITVVIGEPLDVRPLTGKAEGGRPEKKIIDLLRQRMEELGRQAD